MLVILRKWLFAGVGRNHWRNRLGRIQNCWLWRWEKINWSIQLFGFSEGIDKFDLILFWPTSFLQNSWGWWPDNLRERTGLQHLSGPALDFPQFAPPAPTKASADNNFSPPNVFQWEKTVHDDDDDSNTLLYSFVPPLLPNNSRSVPQSFVDLKCFLDQKSSNHTRHFT